MKHVLLVGATSALGGWLVSRLAADGHQVRAMVRRPETARWPEPVEIVRGDLGAPATLPAACDGVDLVISIAGAPLHSRWQARATFDAVDHLGTRALALAASSSGIRRFVYLSVAGEYPAHLEYVAAHRRAETALREAGLAPSIVRATGFHGLLSSLVDLARVGAIPVPGSGEVRTNPIAEPDLADVIADQVEAEPAVIAVGGPEVLTRRAIAERAFEAIAKPPRIVRVPVRALRLGSRALSFVNPRLGDLGQFVAHLHAHDGIAPAVGTTTLLESFRRYAGT